MDALKEKNLTDQATTIVSFIQSLRSSLNRHIFDFEHFPVLDKEEQEFVKARLESVTIKTSFGEVINLHIVFASSENTRRRGPSPVTVIHVHMKKIAASA